MIPSARVREASKVTHVIVRWAARLPNPARKGPPPTAVSGPPGKNAPSARQTQVFEGRARSVGVPRPWRVRLWSAVSPVAAPWRSRMLCVQNMDTENKPVNYIGFYDDEKLLFETVGPQFRRGIDPSVMHFETLLAFKSERPGDAHWMRLIKICGGTMEDAVAAICADIRSAADEKARLEVLMRKWQFYLPTAVTILAVFYPEFFTMYDVRTRNQTTTEDWSQRSFTDALWKHYCEFKDKVVALAPLGWELRDADRYVNGQGHL